MEGPPPVLFESEELNRLRESNPQEWWRQYQAFCAMIDAQQPIPRNSKAGCLAQQEKWRRAGLLPPLNQDDPS